MSVVDIGSNSVRLQVVEAAPGAPPLPIYGRKRLLRLAEHVAEDGTIGRGGADDLESTLAELVADARAQQSDELIAFATAAVREAPNAPELIGEVGASLGLEIRMLSGEDEARFIFLAVRRWLGWRAGSLIVLDIGGGSLEVACGRDERPEVAVSLPLGAGRLTREHLRHDPPSRQELESLREDARSSIREVAERLRWEGKPATAVGTSSTLRHLARLAGAASRREGPFEPRILTRRDCKSLALKLPRMSPSKRARLPGVSKETAHQMVGGAIIAHLAMSALNLRELTISPWALREGILLHRIDGLSDADDLRVSRLVAHATHEVGSRPVSEIDRRSAVPVA